MTDFEDMDGLISAYADGELDEAMMAEVEAHIAANPNAQKMLAMHRETSSLMRAAFPASLYARELSVARPAPVTTRRFRIPQYGWAIAASLVMGIVGYGTGIAIPGLVESDRDRMLTGVAEYHSIYSRETVHLVEVPASQTEHLKTWLSKRVDRPLVIPDFKDAGLTFAGGRMVVLEGSPVAELMYTREKGLPIAFCVVPHKGKPVSLAQMHRGTVNLATWEDGTHSFIVVGEADPAVIKDLALAAQKQL